MAANPNMSRSVCRRLRSKGMFVDVEPDPTVPDMSSQCWWCTHTMNALGPDGREAEDELCKPGRSCFESF